MIPTPQSRVRVARRLDREQQRRERDRAAADLAIVEMRDRGRALHCTFRPNSRIWSLTDGDQLTEGAAQFVIADARVVACDLGLFPGVTLPMTWRWADEP